MKRTIDDINKRIPDGLMGNARITITARQTGFPDRPGHPKQGGVTQGSGDSQAIPHQHRLPCVSYKRHARIHLQLKKGNLNAARALLTDPDRKVLHAYQIADE